MIRLRAGLPFSLTGALLWLGFVLFSACRNAEPERPRTALDTTLAASALRTYADIAYAAYVDALRGADTLERAASQLVAQPSTETLAAAKQAWISARAPYVETEVYRFYDGPIDQVEGFINSWPIDENYVDSDDPNLPPGVIQDVQTYPELDESLLTRLNLSQGETSVSTGYHVIEFLLWGQDTSASGPGNRTYAAFLGTANNSMQARRGRYLLLACKLLRAHLAQVAEAWKPETPANFRAHFLQLPVHAALGLAFKGMGSLSGPELSGERLTVAYETKDQENEHSCFSDTTHLDLVGNAVGIENVCLGRYRARVGAQVEGLGLCALVRSVARAQGEQLKAQIRESVRAAKAVPAPFDQAILGSDNSPGRVAVALSIRALQTQTQTLVKAAASLGAELGLASARANLP